MAEEQTTGKVAMIWVPDELAGEVKNYASSLNEEPTHDVSGYAAFVKGIGELARIYWAYLRPGAAAAAPSSSVPVEAPVDVIVPATSAQPKRDSKAA